MPESCESPGLRRRILLVDDDADIRTGTRVRLESAGYEVFCASDGEEALNMAVASHPDLIVLDVRMPGMDGLTALGKLQSLAETSDIPVVMLSASVFDQQSALDGGARFFMKKPYFAPRLLAAVNAAIADRQTTNLDCESTNRMSTLCGNDTWSADGRPAPLMVDERRQPPALAGERLVEGPVMNVTTLANNGIDKTALPSGDRINRNGDAVDELMSRRWM